MYETRVSKTQNNGIKKKAHMRFFFAVIQFKSSVNASSAVAT